MRETRSAWIVVAVAMLLATSSSAQNLATNGTFDFDVTGWSFAYDTVEFEWLANEGSDIAGGSGPGAMEVRMFIWNGGSNGPDQVVTVEEGVEYELRAAVLRPGDPDNVSTGIGLYVQWRDPDFGFLGSDWVASTLPADDQWVEIGGTTVAPGGAAAAEVFLFVRNPALPDETRPGIAWFDDVWFAEFESTTAVHELFYPAAAEAAGAQGTHWTTSARVASLVDFEVTLAAAMLHQGRDNTGAVAAPTVLGVIPPHGALVVDDIVGRLGESSVVGGLYLRATAEAAGLPARLVTATSYTWTPDAAGSGGYGQGLPAVEAGGPGQSAVAGLVQGAAYRTNVGALNTSSETIEVEIRILDSSGAEVVTARWMLQPYEQRQESLTALGVPSLESGSAVMTRTSAAGSYVGYISTVDQLSGDATYNRLR